MSKKQELTLPISSDKRRGRPFEPGNTMSKGRPKGSLNKTTRLVRDILAEQADGIAYNLGLLAQTGNTAALKLVMERICPVRPGGTVEFDLPPVRYAEDIAPAYAALLQAIAKGQVTPTEGFQITQVLEAQAKVVGLHVGPPWQPDKKAFVERLTKMQEEGVSKTPETSHAGKEAA